MLMNDKNFILYLLKIIFELLTKQRNLTKMEADTIDREKNRRGISLSDVIDD